MAGRRGATVGVRRVGVWRSAVGGRRVAVGDENVQFTRTPGKRCAFSPICDENVQFTRTPGKRCTFSQLFGRVPDRVRSRECPTRRAGPKGPTRPGVPDPRPTRLPDLGGVRPAAVGVWACRPCV